MTVVLVNSIQTISHNFAGVTSPTITLTLVEPDGTTVTPTVTTAPVPDGTYLGSATPTFGQKGAYTALWQAAGGPQSIIRQDDIFAANTDILRIVREKLNNKDTTQLSDEGIASALCFVSRLLFAQLSDTIASYSAVPAIDAYLVDRALGYLAAAYLRPIVNKTMPSGELKSVQIGTDVYEFTDLSARAAHTLDPLEIQWFDEAWEALLATGIMSLRYAALTSAPMMRVSGARKAARTHLGLSDQPDYNLWGDPASQWAWSRNMYLPVRMF